MAENQIPTTIELDEDLTALKAALNSPGRFRVYVSTTNVVNIDVDAESAADAEQVIKDWILSNDDRFYNGYSGPSNGDDFDISSVSADICLEN